MVLLFVYCYGELIAPVAQYESGESCSKDRASQSSQRLPVGSAASDDCVTVRIGIFKAASVAPKGDHVIELIRPHQLTIEVARRVLCQNV